MARSAAVIAGLYTAFALAATGLNLGAQGILLALYDGPHRVTAALLLGTGVGLVVKYVLDKRWIFADPSTGVAAHARAFSLYTLMGVATTAVFWGTELAFAALFGEDWALAGGALGLALGYFAKYRLDRRFVFVEATST